MNKNFSFRSRRAYTLMELSISIGMLGIVAGVIYTVLNGGMILYSKNVATNYSSLAVRGSSSRMVQDIHESVGRATLIEANFTDTPVANKTAPGIRFPILLNSTAVRILSDGSNSKTISTVSSTSTVSLKIDAQANPPKIGDIVVFPDINDLSGNTLTRKITAVTLGSPTTISMKDLGITLNLDPATSAPDPTVIYIARLAAYMLDATSKELRYYPDASNAATYTVVTTNLKPYIPSGATGTNYGPFSIYSTGSSDPGNAVLVNLLTINADTGNRSFMGDTMVLSEIIPPKTFILQSTNYN